jgi:hypothetical protein
MERMKLALLVACVVVVVASCNYADMARSYRAHDEPVPWWCHPTDETPVTEGPASGTVDWYAGTHKGPLTWDQCEALSATFDQARAYAMQWPTASAATADGWKMATPYVPGMGTHHVQNAITPEHLNSPTFNPADPDLSAFGLDDVFDPTRPEVLQYDGNGPTAKLVGFDYYVHTDTGLPPEGFEGNNDWWHHHPKICFRKTDAVMIGFNQSNATCTASNGINVNMSNFYMLHVWILDDMVYTPDVYAGMMPCISGGTAIHDPQDPCHWTSSAMGMDHSTMDHSTMDHSTMDHSP